jgi:integrase
VADRVEDLVELFIGEHVSAREIARLLRREVIPTWGRRSVHELTKRQVIDLVTEIAARGTPATANKLLKVVKTFFGWCVGHAILELSPAKGVAAPARERARDRVLDDKELARIIRAARQIGGPYGAIVELLARTGQRREEVAQLTWDEIDLAGRTWTLPASRTKNGKPHIVHLSKAAIAVLVCTPKLGNSLSRSPERSRFRASVRRNATSTSFQACRIGGCMICVAPASQAWLGLASPRTSPTRCSTTRVGRFRV